MPVLKILLHEQEVDAVLAEKGLMFGFVEPSHALLQLEGTEQGNPCVILVVEIEGKPVAVKTTLKLFTVALQAMWARVEREMPPQGTPVS